MKSPWICITNKLPRIGELCDIWFISDGYRRVTNKNCKGSSLYRSALITGYCIPKCQFQERWDGKNKYYVFDNLEKSYKHEEYVVDIENSEVSHWKPIASAPRRTEVQGIMKRGENWHYKSIGAL